MTMGRLKRVRFLLMIGISLFIPLFPVYSLYADLLETVLPSSDMSFEDPDDEDLSTCHNKFKPFVPMVSSDRLPPWTHLGSGSSLLSFSLTSYCQTTPVLRC